MLLSGPRGLSVRGAVWLLAVAETVAWGLLYYGFGVLLVPMAERAHVAPADVALAFSLALLASGAAAPVVGRAVDRDGPGRVMTLGAALGATGFAALAWARDMPSLCAAWALLGIAHACTSYEPAFAAITRWHTDPFARRRALLVLTSVAGFASTIFVPVASWLVERLGLRDTVLIFAATMAFVVAPLGGVIGRVRTTNAPADGPRERREGGARRGLAVLAVVFALHAFASTGASLYFYPALMAQRLVPADAAGLAGLVGAAQVPARLLYGPMCDFVSTRARLPVLLVLQALALVGSSTFTGLPRVVALLVFGAANGLSTLERATLVSAWLGDAGYGARSGVVAAASAVTRACAPFVVALVAGASSYPHAFTGLAAVLGVATLVHVSGDTWRRFPASVPRERR